MGPLKVMKRNVMSSKHCSLKDKIFFILFVLLSLQMNQNMMSQIMTTNSLCPGAVIAQVQTMSVGPVEIKGLDLVQV